MIGGQLPEKQLLFTISYPLGLSGGRCFSGSFLLSASQSIKRRKLFAFLLREPNVMRRGKKLMLTAAMKLL